MPRAGPPLRPVLRGTGRSHCFLSFDTHTNKQRHASVRDTDIDAFSQDRHSLSALEKILVDFSGSRCCSKLSLALDIHHDGDVYCTCQQ